jgi:hypothetical protein
MADSWNADLFEAWAWPAWLGDLSQNPGKLNPALNQVLPHHAVSNICESPGGWIENIHTERANYTQEDILRTAVEETIHAVPPEESRNSINKAFDELMASSSGATKRIRHGETEVEPKKQKYQSIDIFGNAISKYSS